MIRRVVAMVAFGALVLAPPSFAQDLEGLPVTGMEKAKTDAGDLVLRMGFTFASPAIPETLRQRLDRAVALLTNERAAGDIEVAGHTDSVGSTEYNQILSEKRAAAVKAYLVEHGIAADRISVVGYGESSPRATNLTLEGQRKNRRVEVRVTG